jgi:hypothetical protein
MGEEFRAPSSEELGFAKVESKSLLSLYSLLNRRRKRMILLSYRAGRKMKKI